MKPEVCVNALNFQQIFNVQFIFSIILIYCHIIFLLQYIYFKNIVLGCSGDPNVTGLISIRFFETRGSTYFSSNTCTCMYDFTINKCQMFHQNNIYK